jgi:hypothetical protein
MGIVSDFRVGIEVWQTCLVEEPRMVGKDEFEFSRNQLILGQRNGK